MLNIRKEISFLIELAKENKQTLIMNLLIKTQSINTKKYKMLQSLDVVPKNLDDYINKDLDIYLIVLNLGLHLLNNPTKSLEYITRQVMEQDEKYKHYKKIYDELER